GCVDRRAVEEYELQVGGRAADEERVRRVDRLLPRRPADRPAADQFGEAGRRLEGLADHASEFGDRRADGVRERGLRLADRRERGKVDRTLDQEEIQTDDAADRDDDLDLGGRVIETAGP